MVDNGDNKQSQVVGGKVYSVIKKLGDNYHSDTWLCESIKGPVIIKVSKMYPQDIIDDMKQWEGYNGPYTTLEVFKDREFGTCSNLAFIKNGWHPFMSKYYSTGIISFSDITCQQFKNPYDEDVAYCVLQYIPGITLSEYNFDPNDEYKLAWFCSSILSALSLLECHDLCYDNLTDDNIVYNETVGCFTITDLHSITTDSKKDVIITNDNNNNIITNNIITNNIITNNSYDYGITDIANLLLLITGVQFNHELFHELKLRCNCECTNIVDDSQKHMLTKGNSVTERFIKELYMTSISTSGTSSRTSMKQLLIMLSTIISEPVYLFTKTKVHTYHSGIIIETKHIPSYDDVMLSPPLPNTDLNSRFDVLKRKFSKITNINNSSNEKQGQEERQEEGWREGEGEGKGEREGKEKEQDKKSKERNKHKINLNSETTVKNLFVLESSLDMLASSDNIKVVGKEILYRFGIKAKNHKRDETLVKLPIPELYAKIGRSHLPPVSVIDLYIMNMLIDRW